MTKKQAEKKLWIEDTQMYQRVAKKPVDSVEVLSKVYDEMTARKSKT